MLSHSSALDSSSRNSATARGTIATPQACGPRPCPPPHGRPALQDPERDDRSLILTTHPSPDLHLNPSFISVRRKARRIPLHERAQRQRMDLVPPDPFDPEETWEQALADAAEADTYRRSRKGRPLRILETR